MSTASSKQRAPLDPSAPVGYAAHVRSQIGFNPYMVPALVLGTARLVLNRGWLGGLLIAIGGGASAVLAVTFISWQWVRRHPEGGLDPLTAWSERQSLRKILLISIATFPAIVVLIFIWLVVVDIVRWMFV